MATPAVADEWPSRPVRMVNTFAAGGTADVLTRLVADQLSATFKQQFFVETRAGAGRHDRGEVGRRLRRPTATTSRSPTSPIWCWRRSAIPSSATIRKRDLTNIGYVAGSPIVLSVSANGSIKTLQGLHRAGPRPAQKPLTYSSSGRRQLRTTGGGGFRQEGRHQDRARALQGRLAGPDRSGRRPYRVLGADRVVHRGAGARRPASRDRAFACEPPAGLPGCADA